MANQRFNSFEHKVAGGSVSTGYSTSSLGVSLDRNCVYVDPTSDTVFSAPVDPLPFSIGRATGRQANTTAFGASHEATGTNVPAAITHSTAVAIARADLGSPAEVWVTFDLFTPIPGSSYIVSATTGANNLRTEPRYCVFAFGDLKLVFQGTANFTTSPDKWDLKFDLYNGATKLGTVTVANTDAQWAFVKVHAKLHASTGAFDVTIDGNSASYTGLNSVATTALASVDYLYTGVGVIGLLSGSGIVLANSYIDNLFWSDTGFPTGRPVTQRVTFASDYSLTNWSAVGSGATTVADALSAIDAKYARGVGPGNKGTVTPGTITTSGWLTNILGWQFQVNGVSNVDLDAAKKLKAGITLSGSTVYSSVVTAATPPATPSYINIAPETIFYKTGSTPYALTDVPNCKFTLEVA